MLDQSSLSPDQAVQVEKSLLANLMLPEGQKFRPYAAVNRLELAEALMRAGLVPQYMAAAAMFTDVRDTYSRNVVESTPRAGSSVLTTEPRNSLRRSCSLEPRASNPRPPLLRFL
jgi:hypothetical protein